MYHPGELEVQARAGVQYQADRVGKIIGAAMPLAAQEFLRRQPFAVLSSVDVRGRVWVSILTGKPGFIRTTDEQTVAIDGMPLSHDPLRENLQANPSAGMLVMEFATRKRMRVNGKGELCDNHVIVYAEQVYSNCPKYIQAREWEVTETASLASLTATVQRSKVLSTAQQNWIRRADTFFIGSFHPLGGADASHRG
ncbi:MAG TPA: pyridoxamine 5'-phosphate oxidase family protein, partial [Gammaproteobacteria bacterium]|nr:pyridoxamine 5'-phosphate oxidase family protein [Gammaproteobacteria bacterium]